MHFRQLTYLHKAFNGSLSSLISGWTQLEISLGSILRVKDFELIVPREISTKREELPGNWPGQGAIEISGMAAQYRYVSRKISEPSPLLIRITNKLRTVLKRQY